MGLLRLSHVVDPTAIWVRFWCKLGPLQVWFEHVGQFDSDRVGDGSGRIEA